MTMVAAVVQGDRAWLYADTAITDPSTGKVLCFAPKLQVARHFPAAVGITMYGPPAASSALRCLEVHDLRTFYAMMPTAIRRFRESARDLGFANPMMRLVALCWDEQVRKPRLFVAGDGLEGFGLGPDEDGGETPYFFGSDLDHRQHWNFQSPEEPEHFHPVHGAVAVFDHVRSVARVPLGGGVSGVHVGGELQTVEVTQKGAFAYRIHEWGDRAGERIEPDRHGAAWAV